LGNLPVISVTLLCLTGASLGSSLGAGAGVGVLAAGAVDLGPSYVVVALVSRSITLGADVLPESHSSAVRAASSDGAGGKMLRARELGELPCGTC
jgi:predicted RNA methylase